MVSESRRNGNALAHWRLDLTKARVVGAEGQFSIHGSGADEMSGSRFLR